MSGTQIKCCQNDAPRQDAVNLSSTLFLLLLLDLAVNSKQLINKSITLGIDSGLNPLA